VKILHLSTSDIDGGAARGAYQIHQALRQIDVNSIMLVANKLSADSTVIGPRDRGIDKILGGLRPAMERFAVRKYSGRGQTLFSAAVFPGLIQQRTQEFNPDIINLHWINNGFLRPEDFKGFHKPLVWTLRDMWGFTGGCHYAGDCLGYYKSCGSCSLLSSQLEDDLSRRVWKRKQKAWQNLDLTLVAISNWLGECARKSQLFQENRIVIIPSTIDTKTFKPYVKNIARELLGLPQNKQLILFGAVDALHDQRKGFRYLTEALQILSKTSIVKNTELVVFGASQPKHSLDLGMTTTYMGRLFDDLMLALVYAAVDVMVVPSIQEAFGKTAVESLACGTPVVCFDTTGLKDIVDHQENGYRAKCFDSIDLANGISWVLENTERWHVLSRQARAKVEQKFDPKMQAEAYLDLYQELFQASTSRLKF
jgi:glycosyltransferase involved in cell wall biosynthesis